MLTILAALCAGLAGGCLFALAAGLLAKVEMDPLNAPEGEDPRRLPLIFRIFLPLSSNVSFLTRRESLSGMRKNTFELLQSAGVDQLMTAEQFLGIRVLMLLMGLLLMVLMSMADQQLCGFLILVLMLLYPETWLKKTARQRHLSILKALPNLLDLLTLSVEAGKDFLTALRDILARRPPDVLGDEFKRTLHEIQLGKQRQQALRDLSQRVHQPELTSVLNAIVQADELGVAIGQLLRIQGDQLRHKRFARAEKLANEAPVKIMFPVVIFIFPCVFAILVGPIIYQALNTLAG
ncbi:MAG: type II secretion system F family protein [Lentisphaeria bacterium]|nr:type II secretion system F family protein [Lentisphaeria bacterium]